MKTKDILFYFGGAAITAVAAKSAYDYYQADQEAKKKAKAEKEAQELMTYATGLLAKVARSELKLADLDPMIAKAITAFSGIIGQQNATNLHIFLSVNGFDKSLSALLERQLLAAQEAGNQKARSVVGSYFSS